MQLFIERYSFLKIMNLKFLNKICDISMLNTGKKIKNFYIFYKKLFYAKHFDTLKIYF